MRIVLLAVLLKRKMFCEQFRFNMIIDRNTFEWYIHIEEGRGVSFLSVINKWYMS